MTKDELYEKLQVAIVSTTCEGCPWGYKNGQPSAAANVTFRWGRRSYTEKFWFNSEYLLTVNDCYDQLFGDATAGEMDEDEFYREFGYGNDNKRARKGCVKIYKKVLYLFGDDYDLYREALEAYYG